MNEETDNKANELKTINGTFVDSILDTLEVPSMTYEEADSYRENEKFEEEGGK